MNQVDIARYSSPYAEQLAHLLDDKRIGLEWYTLPEVAEVFGVSHNTPAYWRKQGYIRAEKYLSKKHTPGKKPREVWRYYVSSQEIDRILKEGPRLIVASMRVWPRILYRMDNSLPVR